MAHPIQIFLSSVPALDRAIGHGHLSSSALTVSSSFLYVKIIQISVLSCLTEPFAFCGMVSEAENGLASEDKKLLLERYGLDPDEFLSEPPPPKVLSLSFSLPSKTRLVAEKPK